MRQILYVGKFFPKRLLKTIRKDSKGKIGFSNHNFELSMVRGLCEQENICLSCISIPGVYSYPHNNRALWTRAESYREGNAEIHSVGFCNLVILNKIWKQIASFCKLAKTIRDINVGQVDIIVNTPNLDTLLPLWFLKRLMRKKMTITLIVPDIPSFVSSMDKMNPIKQYTVGLLDKLSMKLASESDYLVLLTEQMMDFFPNTTKHIVMEGIVDVKSMSEEVVIERKNTKSILYTGTLRRIFGVMDLVNAFELAKIPDAELWICGSGDAESEITLRAETNPQIKFFGLLDSKEALILQKKASVLVNPRTSDGEYTKYSFPSKTMEYLLSGNPVIAHKLPGIPEEYFEYIIAPENESVIALAETLIKVMEMSDSDRVELGLRGRDFVSSEKNSVVQMGKVLDLILSY